MNDERRREEWLLKDAAILYERHKPDCSESFNVFTTMFNERDEVNLHSRFLAVLLGHPGEEGEANLRDFMGEFAPESLRDFAPKGVKVERERHHIDILITNDHGQALAIENKIDAEDQPLQLQRYRGKLERQGYKDIHLLYLTIDGRPFEGSRGELSEKDYTSISYKDILGWLKRCRERACNEPELRETIAQYLRLIEKLTGKDQAGSELMKELKELCLRDDNLHVAHHLAEALPYAKAFLVHDIWKKITDDLEGKLDENIKRSSDISEDAIRDVIRKGNGNITLYYSFGSKPDYLCVEANRELGYIAGIYEEDTKKFNEIRSRLQDKFGPQREHRYWWPWCRVLQRDGTGLNSSGIEKLSNDETRNELAKYIAKSAGEELNAIYDELSSAIS